MKDASLKVIGGARIGWANATWPFATMSVSAEQLSVSGALIGSYSFKPDEIVALERYGSIPIFSSGVRIIHTNPEYPEKIIFWCFGSPRRLIERIGRLGFRPSAPQSAVPSREGMAFRWSFIILLVVVWNALFIVDGFAPWKQPKPPGAFTLLALVLLFLSAFALNFSKRFQAVALKPGRSVSEVRSIVLLTLVVSTIMLIAFVAQIVAG